MADEHQDSDMIQFFLVIGAMLLFITLMWIYFHVQLSSGVRWIRVGQLWIIGFFTDDYDVMRQQLIDLRPRQLNFDHILISTQSVVAGALRYPIAIVLGLMAVCAFFIQTDSKFRRRMSLETMLVEHAKGFPVTTPALRFNPIKESPNRRLGSPVPAKMPMFAEALAPEEWIAANSIPQPEKDKVDSTHARRAFAKQLGARWKGPEKLPLHAQALFAVFAMKGNGLRDESDKMLEQLALCWTPKKRSCAHRQASFTSE